MHRFGIVGADGGDVHELIDLTGTKHVGDPAAGCRSTQACRGVPIDQALAHRPGGEAPGRSHPAGDRRPRCPASFQPGQPGPEFREIQVGELLHPPFGREGQQISHVSEVGAHGVRPSTTLVAQMRAEA